MSLPYYGEFGYEAEVVNVHSKHSLFIKEPKLQESIPHEVKFHTVDAFSIKWTSKIGLGSIALRSLYFYFFKVNSLLKSQKYDLIFFSTNQFPLTVLGKYWKAKFGVPYVIDFQDPWHTDYYRDKPVKQQPKKYFISYYLNKILEPIAVKSCDGLIAVSKDYITDLKQRYTDIANIPASVITFGYSEIDFQLAKSIKTKPVLQSKKLKLTYIGVLGSMMELSLNLFFRNIQENRNFKENFHLELKGTSYANQLTKTATPIAEKYKITNIEEDPNRIGAIEVLSELNACDGLIIFGTDDEAYTASKLYPYLQVGKPILAIFHPKSHAFKLLKEISDANLISLYDDDIAVEDQLNSFLENVSSNKGIKINQSKFKEFSAENLTQKQCELFDLTLKAKAND